MNEPRGIDPTKPYLNLTRSLADVYDIEVKWYVGQRMWFLWKPRAPVVKPLPLSPQITAPGLDEAGGLAAHAEPARTLR